MKQFKFKFTVGSSAIFVLKRIRKARRYIAETDKYTDEDRFNFACEIIDLFSVSGMYPLADCSAKAFFINTETDRLHPNEAGHKLLADVIERYL